MWHFSLYFKYFLLLAELTPDELEILNWGEWQTLFDSNSFHSDERSMIWLKKNLKKFEKFNDKRESLRTLVPLLNKNFCTTNRDLCTYAQSGNSTLTIRVPLLFCLFLFIVYIRAFTRRTQFQSTNWGSTRRRNWFYAYII